MANGQLSRKAKVVREPKSLWDMVIPCEIFNNDCFIFIGKNHRQPNEDYPIRKKPMRGKYKIN